MDSGFNHLTFNGRFIIFFCFVSALCPGNCWDAFAGETINGSIQHDGLEREYILYVPDIYTGTIPVPLILNFHGYGSNAFQQMNYGDFRSIADAEGCLVAHPQGTLFEGTTHWNVGGWTAGSTADDVGFTAALIDALSTDYAIDPDRIYATGMSNGGYMSFLLACQLGNRIAAIASVTGSMTPETYMDCLPEHPMPVLQMHGTGDTVVPYTGASWTKSIDDVLAFWVSENNCNNPPETTMLPDSDPNDGSTVERIVYSDGSNGVSVVHFKIFGGDHAWPGTAFGGPGTNYDIDASDEIWTFFSRYDINGRLDDPTPTATPATPIPTPTTVPEVGVSLMLSKKIFRAGDDFHLAGLIRNNGPDIDSVPWVILLDAYGDYFWYPSWDSAFDYEPIYLHHGEQTRDILQFTWPDIDGSAEGIRFYGALMTRELNTILGEWDTVTFGWTD